MIVNFESILKECCAGSEMAWKAFIERFHPLIQATVARVSAGDGDDIAQSVYEKLIKDDYSLLRQFKGCYPQFLVYIKNLSYNTALNHVKKASKLSERTIDEEFDERICPNFSLERQNEDAYDEALERLRAAISTLKPEYREIILCLMKGYKHREISEMLGIPINTSLTRGNRAKEILKKIMTDEIKPAK